MKTNQGFTLVELLVVIAIIAILASIVVPGITGYIESGRATKAISEINGIELAVTRMLSDANRSSLNQLFHPRLGQYIDGLAPAFTQFHEAQRIYNDVMYVLLREGRAILSDDLRQWVREDVVKNLGTSYMADLGLDPWGENIYQIYPGPYEPRSNTPIPFRVYSVSETADTKIPSTTGNRLPHCEDFNAPEGFIFVEDPIIEEFECVGSPAGYDLPVYVYSLGKNFISGQYLYEENSSFRAYAVQEEHLMGGGDDINNWDKTQSYMRHYN